MNKTLKDTLDVLWFFVTFFLIQLFFLWGTAIVLTLSHGAFSFHNFTVELASIPLDGRLLALSGALSSVTTLLVFFRLKWADASNAYLATRPWGTIAWAVLLALGALIPLEWLYEQLGMSMPAAQEQLLRRILSEPWGYLAVGILAPWAEEAVFRGAILRTLLRFFPGKRHWLAIVLSALLFALAHGNNAQGLHALLMGLLMGWMFYRTNSIVPGIVLHWTNNTVSYILYNLMPQLPDGKLIDLFHGSHQLLLGAVFFSLCIFVPSLFQLSLRMKRGE